MAKFNKEVFLKATFVGAAIGAAIYIVSKFVL
jgi:hypothetical protein